MLKIKHSSKPGLCKEQIEVLGKGTTCFIIHTSIYIVTSICLGDTNYIPPPPHYCFLKTVIYVHINVSDT